MLHPSDEPCTTLEPSLFVSLNEEEVYKTELSHILPVMRVVAAQNNLNLKLAREWSEATELLIKYVKCN